MKLHKLAFALLFVCGVFPLAARAASTNQQVALSLIPATWQRVCSADLADSPQYSSELAQAIQAAAQETGVPPQVIWGVAHTETLGRHWNEAGRVKRGSAGEIGLMQVKPFWARAIQREYGVDLDLYQLADNVRAGAYILRRGGADPNAMLGYYNTGRRVRNTGYQRRVASYLASLEDLAAQAPGAGQPADAVSPGTAEVADDAPALPSSDLASDTRRLRAAAVSALCQARRAAVRTAYAQYREAGWTE